MKILCQTLFDITRTNVHSRRGRLDSDSVNLEAVRQRGQQGNFETVIQIISMRSQPENITDPEKAMTTTDGWGTRYKNKAKIPAWSFTFEVEQDHVFNNGTDHFGYLLADCAGVPMITGLEEWAKVGGQLDVTDGGANIKFRVVE